MRRASRPCRRNTNRRPGAFRSAALLALLLATAQAPAADQPRQVTIRAGDHADFGRLVFDASAQDRYSLTRNGDQVRIRFRADVVLIAPPRRPRNIVALRTTEAAVTLTLAPGATLRRTRLGDRVVIDVIDPPRSAPAETLPPVPLPGVPTETPDPVPSQAGPADTSPSGPLPAAPAGTSASAPPPATHAETPSPVPPQAAPAGTSPPGLLAAAPAGTSASAPPPATHAETPSPVPSQAAPAEAPLPVPPPAPPLQPAAATSGFVIPFGDGVGAAMFRRESVTYVVFDESRVIDLPEPAERNGFVALSVHLLPDAAVLRIVPSQGRHVVLSRDAAGWRLQASGTAPLPRPIVPAVSRSQIRFDAPFGGHALTIADPDNGAALLIGTLRRPGWGVDTERRSADFVVVPTVQGVVVEALSDRALLRADAQGFVLRATGAGLSVNVPVR